MASTNLGKRVIPTFLYDGQQFVKGVSFSNYRPAGVPVTTLKAINAQDPDEIVVIAIGENFKGWEAGLKALEPAIKELSVPLTLGGRIRGMQDAEIALRAGAEKVLVSDAFVNDPHLLAQLIANFGSQAVVAAVEYRVEGGRAYATKSRGNVRLKLSPSERAEALEQGGAGEIVFVSVSGDGNRSGLDVDLLASWRSRIGMPVLALGGVGTFDHLVEGFATAGLDGICCGSLFTFGDNNPIRARSYLKNHGIQSRGIR